MSDTNEKSADMQTAGLISALIKYSRDEKNENIQVLIMTVGKTDCSSSLLGLDIKYVHLLYRHQESTNQSTAFAGNIYIIDWKY